MVTGYRDPPLQTKNPYKQAQPLTKVTSKGELVPSRDPQSTQPRPASRHKIQHDFSTFRFRSSPSQKSTSSPRANLHTQNRPQFQLRPASNLNSEPARPATALPPLLPNNPDSSSAGTRTSGRPGSTGLRIDTQGRTEDARTHDVTRTGPDRSSKDESQGTLTPRPSQDLLPQNITVEDALRRPSTTQLSAVSDVPPTPTLRSSASIPDYRLLRSAHPSSASSSPSTPLTPGFAPQNQAPRPPQTLAQPSDNSSRHEATQREALKPPPMLAQQYDDKSGRDSVRSAATNASSSVFTGSGTERSSSQTNITAYSDSTTSHNVKPSSPQEDEISIDELLSMYETGFADVKDETSKHSQHSPTAGLRKNEPPVPKIPTSYSLLAPPKTPAKEKSSSDRTSVQIMSGQFGTSRPSSSPSPRISDVSRDRYGFKTAAQCVKQEQYDKWNQEYQGYLDRRQVKWNALMKQHDLSTVNPKVFPSRSEKVKRFIRKGIPPQWRGAAWFYYAGGPSELAKNQGLYSTLCKEIEDGYVNDQDKEHIERDLHRTFPDNKRFKDPTVPTPRISTISSATPSTPTSSAPSSPNPNASPEPPMIGSLRRVLRAFAIHKPKIGYCQSLNFLAGQLLLFLDGDEEKAFHLLCILTTEHLPGTHGLALEGANIDISVLMGTLKDSMPILWDKLDDREANAAAANANKNQPSYRKSISRRGTTKNRRSDNNNGALPTVSLATTSWFMSCFVGTLPVETCCRVWDVLFFEGSKTLFRVALGVFRFVDQEVKQRASCRSAKAGSVSSMASAAKSIDPMEVFQIVQMLPRGLLDANALMEASFGRGLEGRGLLSRDVVEARREERREQFKMDRVKSLAGSAHGEQMVADGSMPPRGRAAQLRDGEEDDGAKSRRSLSRGASIKRLPSRFKSMRSKKNPLL